VCKECLVERIPVHDIVSIHNVIAVYDVIPIHNVVSIHNVIAVHHIVAIHDIIRIDDAVRIQSKHNGRLASMFSHRLHSRINEMGIAQFGVWYDVRFGSRVDHLISTPGQEDREYQEERTPAHRL